MNYNFNNIKIAVIGLGYVGLPIAVAFGKQFPVIGFDLNKKRIRNLNLGIDINGEFTKKDLTELFNLKITSQMTFIEDCNIFIITVPTPVDNNNAPDLGPLKSASLMVGGYLKKNDLVIYESTVYPGCTEEICVPILEKESLLKYNKDFFCGYSPERINPGDKDHTIESVVKITSGSNKETKVFVNALYKKIILAGTYQASSIKVAEAAKVIENIQRDVNIALINELAMIFNKMKIDTSEVLRAAETKWNFIPFKPGLVGGHCIGIDPYYLTYKSLELGYQPEMILAGRKINNNMGYYIVDKTIEQLSKKGVNLTGAKITILGLTFKENCPDLRNSKVITIIDKLKSFNCKISVVDYWADPLSVKNLFGVKLKRINQIENQDAIILAVGHKKYSSIKNEDWDRMLKKNGLIMDVKSIYSKKQFINQKIRYWGL